MKVNNDIEKILVSKEDIKKRVKELARTIEKDYDGKNPLVICLLNGAAVFYVNLMMEIDMPLEMHYIRVSSYGNGTQSSRKVQMKYDLEVDVKGRDLILVDDIVDSGNTLKAVIELLYTRGANSIECCCLLDKSGRREVEMKPKYIGFNIPNEFVVGYGLDYAQKYRNVTDIGVLKKEVYTNNV